MFVLSFRTNRLISSGGFYFVYFLFFLHICTAFLTIISAFNNDLYEKEEIIQLSMDSIHTVDSSESLFTENTDDNEEKELLLALSTSYDDNRVKITNKQIVNEILIINISSSIRFTPSSIHFTEQSIGIPRMQTVIIVNDDSEPLEIYSLTGTTNEFYSSSLKQTILPPHGGNITINIYYLPRTIGPTSSIFLIKTDRGDFSYDVNGIGISNPYRLRPLVNIEIPLNSTFEYTIQFYNPYNYPLNINEIYTSDENLIIELLSNKNQKNHVKKFFQYHEDWYLKPYETKSIIKINYFAYKLNQLYGFICIKTNFSEKIILPVEINVSNRFGLYSNVDLLEFTTERFIRSIDKSIKIPVYVFNHGINPVMITDVRVTSEHRDYMTVRYKNHPILPDILRLTQIADVIIHPNLIPDHIERIHGYVQVYTSSNSEQPVLNIPFDEKIIHGSLDFNEEETYFYLSDDKSTEECQPIKLFNRYNTPISVYDITINKFELLSRYIQIKHPSSLFYLYPNQWTDLLCITRLKQSASFNSIQAVIDISTNLSHFSLPIHLYNGFLNLDILNDQTNGGIQQNENDPFELLITSIPVNAVRTVRFMLINSNPIDIEINEYDFTISNGDIQFDYLKSLDDNKTKITIGNKKKLSPILIPKQHQAVFVLTIHGTNPPELYTESITIKTTYQTLHINVKYEIIHGSLEFVNKTPIHIDVFPNRLATADIFIENRFDEPVNITRIHFISYGLCFSFTWSDTSIDHRSLQPNKIQKIGRINFDMASLCKSILPPSESTCYCGLNYHPEFKQEWDESISLMNTYQLDHILVTKFRDLWKQWRSLIRKQRIQTNVWLYTNRANISWPVTIGFIWPSVIEQTSSSVVSTPMIVDFEVTFINITKTQDVTIINPSSDLLTYSVALLNNTSFTNDQIFTISTTSKQINNLHNFHLLPNEQITLTVSYRPTSTIKHEMYLIVRNNLTIIEPILLRGEGGIGGLQVGSSLIPIVLEINANLYKLCLNPGGNPILKKILKLQNTGNLQTTIYDISFGHLQCSGQGFSVSVCRGIQIEPHENYDLEIFFQPDYTSDEITETLVLNTNIGLMTLPIIVRIPQRVLSACYKAIPRPPWEWRPYCLCLCTLAVIIILIYSSAVYNAQRLFNDYLSRAEWRHQIQTTDNKIFNLRDLSSAIQDEQKPRERADSNQSADMKKENKHKRSTNSNAIRLPSDNLNAATRSPNVSFKEIPQKVRRATADNGVPKPSKHPIETSTKPLPALRRQKSDQQPSIIPPGPLSSSTVSDEENEPFVVARSKRIVSKRKGSFTKTPPKPITDNAPHPLIRQSSLQSDQKDLIQLDDSTNDQQWHMVSSNKGQRKGTVSRRETSEESQTTNKALKISSADTEKPMILTSSPRAHSSVSRKSIQSRRRHRPTRSPSPTLIPNLTKRKSLKDNTSLINVNRELAFRQLTEQLWAAGLPSSTTGRSMSIHSRCSSAPPSERGGGEDGIIKIHGNNDDNEDENLDWDEPKTPDEDFGRYASQTEHSMDDLTGMNDRVQKPIIPPLMSLSITPPPLSPHMTANTQQSFIMPTSVIKENIEPLPLPQHVPGPIQRPNKLSCSSMFQTLPFLQDSTRSPNTPEVLVQINHLVDHQDSITGIPSNASNLTNSSAMNNDIPTPNVSWTPFSPPEWSTKYESSWPLTATTQNPFAQRQISKDESNLWSEVPINGSWLKFSPTSPSNRQENFWNPAETQPNSSTPWWPKTPSDENNNNDQSRWEFAR